MASSAPHCEESAWIRRISHDLANCLGVILGNADLALMDLGADHPGADYLREIQNSAREARVLCRQMRDPAAEPESGTVPLTPGGQPLRFLLIDDEDAFLSLSDRALRRLGHEVSAFTSPVEALRAFDANPFGFDILITDMNLPETSGLEVAAEFLERAPGLCVCLTSGDVGEDLRERARQLGIRDVLRKPNTIAEFVEVIRRLAGRKGPSISSPRSTPP